MKSKEHNYKNISEKDNSSFCEDSIKNISKIEERAIKRTNLILEYIKNNPNCTPYQISKELEINYATTSQTVKELIFCNLICYKIEIGENNRAHKRVFVPEEDRE